MQGVTIIWPSPLERKNCWKTILKYTAAGKRVIEINKEDKGIPVTDSDIEPKKKTIVKVNPDFKEFIPEFFEDVRNDIKSMKAALQKGEYETVRKTAHKIKGAGGGYGFDAVTDSGRSIEKAAKERNQDETLKWLDELSDYLESVEVVYE